MSAVRTVDIPDATLLFFYKSIILYYENHVLKNPLGFYVNDQQIVALLAQFGTKMTQIQSVPIIEPDTYKKKPETYVIFKQISVGRRKMSTLVSFLGHLRNCFSHGRFSMISIEDETYICLEDYGKKKEVEYLTMICQIPFNAFLRLVMIIQQIQK